VALVQALLEGHINLISYEKKMMQKRDSTGEENTED
jgi:hypothetical protein